MQIYQKIFFIIIFYIIDYNFLLDDDAGMTVTTAEDGNAGSASLQKRMTLIWHGPSLASAKEPQSG